MNSARFPNPKVANSKAAYVIAFVLAAAAVLLKYGLDRVLPALSGADVDRFLFFFPAVMAVAWFSGVGPAVFCLGMTFILSVFFLLEPQFSFFIESPVQRIHALVFLVEGAMICTLAGLLHAAWQQSDKARSALQAAYDNAQRNVVELTRTRDALTKSRSRFERLVESNIIGTFVVSGDGEITNSNEALVRIVATAEGDCGAVEDRRKELPESISALLDDSVREKLYRHGRYGPAEHELVAEGGRRVPVLFGAALFGEEQESHELTTCYLVDLTEIKRTRADLEAAIAEAERANRAKSRLLTNMSHDLRTPMNSISGMIDLALSEDVSAKAHDCLVIARDSARAYLRILNDMLDLSKMDAGKFELSPEPFSTNGLLARTVESFSPIVEKKSDVELTCCVDSDVPPYLIGDHVRLRQVLSNLIDNALKYTNAGSVSLSVHVSPEEPGRDGGDTPNVLLEFRVSDTGTGIAEEDQAIVFAPFRQSDSPHSERKEGSGLGLAIVSELVQAMGGRVWLESKLGEGTHFFFSARFGLATDEEASAVRERDEEEFDAGFNWAHPIASSESANVLVVEDTPANWQLMEKILQKRGHRATIAVNGKDAVWQCRRNAFDVILMDVQMPVMDGFQTTAAIRALPDVDDASATSPDVPIIAVTGYAMADDRAHCLEMGMDAFVAKPIEVGRMLATVERLAGRFRERRGIPPIEPAERIPMAGVARDVTEPVAHGEGNDQPVDLEVSLQRLGGDQELLNDMIALFREDAPELLERIERSLESTQLAEVERAAHSLKGLCANFEARQAVAAANAVRQAAKAGEVALAGERVPKLRREVGRILGFL